MRRAVQRHVGRLPVAFFDQTKAGVLLSRVMTDAEGIRNLVGTGLVEVVGGLLTAVLALGILFYFNAKLTLIALGQCCPSSAVVLLFAFKTLRPLFRERSKINAEVSGRLTESFSGIRVVKAYRAERREALRLLEGRAPPLPQRRADDDRVLGRLGILDAAARRRRRRDHVGRRARDRWRAA